MPSPSDFHDVVSGKRRGVTASLVRWGLRAAEVPYTWAVRYRNHRFDQGHALSQQAGVPVVSVGNLTLGGTGKTPMVAWLAEWFQNRNVHPSIVSRGYRASQGLPSDESLELSARLDGVPHFQNSDRVAAARSAVARGAPLILLDDGFQHRRLARDLDIVLIDALQPTGFGHVFPRGCLREPFRGICRADVVILTRSELIAPDYRKDLQQRVASAAPKAIWLEAHHAPLRLLSSRGDQESLMRLSSENTFAFCGIGNPAGFRETLADCKCYPREWLEFPDHHRYTSGDLDTIRAMARRHESTLIACTHKDLVKIGQERLGDADLRAVQITMKLQHSAPLELRLEEIRQRVSDVALDTGGEK